MQWEGNLKYQCFCVLLQNFAGECKTGDGNHKRWIEKLCEIMQFLGENNTFVTEHKSFERKCQSIEI